jgi:hypothetical protein
VIVCLNITSFAGYAPGAVHFYGTLKRFEPFRELRLEKPLTKRHADEANKKDGVNPGSPSAWEEGQLCERFPSEQSVCDRAEEVCAYLFDEDDLVLIVGGDDFNPYPVLMHPDPDDHGKLNKLARIANVLEWYGRTDEHWRNDIMDLVCKTHERILKEWK